MTGQSRGDLSSVFYANAAFHELLFAKTGAAYLADAMRSLRSAPTQSASPS
jgi:DNA-binding GntR family transcriptional regulator